jgi:Flp pilus assembly protein TadD
MRLLHAAALITSGATAAAAAPLLNPDGKPLPAPAPLVLLKALGRPADNLSPDDEALAQALAGDPSSLGVFAYAMACQEAGFMPAAFAVYQKLDEKIPGQPRLVGLLLRTLAWSRGTKDRLAIAQRYTAKYATMGAAWQGQADVCQSLDDKAGQETALRKAVEVAPHTADALLALAQCLDETAHAPELAALYRELRALLPDDPYIANNLAYCLLQGGGDTAEALKLAEEAAKKLPTNANALHTLGLAQLRGGDLDAGRKNLSIALELRPGDPTMLLDYGQMLIARNKAEEGKQNIELALRYANQLGLDFPRRAEAERALSGA